MFRKRWPEKEMPATMPKIMTALLVAIMLAVAAAPARSAEPVEPNDTARFLAGLPPAPDSPLAALTKDPRWQQHARYFDSIFAREDSNTLSKIRAFSRERLTEKHDTMLYMFSGPDFLYATSFFPKASTYVLSGLEPVGDIPQLTSMSRPAVEGTLQHLEASLGTILNFSFFITKNMKTQLSEGPVYGTLPVLYVFLTRTGKRIRDVSLVSLDEQGNVQVVAEKKSGRYAASAAKGVKIVFTDGDSPSQTLYYFSTNVADGSFARSGFAAFCASLGPADSFIKSASYLLHTGGFSKVRSFLLEHSATILQDDSGIPAAYFDPKKWRFQAFGRYVGPLNINGATYQARMGVLFRNATPIDFGLGYRWKRNESNLLLAEKISSNISGPELAPPLPTRPHKARPTTGSAQSRRKQVESEPAKPVDCGIAGVFSFCSVPQAQTSQ
jgi:hypothetical protein